MKIFGNSQSGEKNGGVAFGFPTAHFGKFRLQIGGAQSVNHGDSEALSLTGDWSIASGGTLPLPYDANVSATSVGIDEQVLTVVFVVEEVT